MTDRPMTPRELSLLDKLLVTADRLHDVADSVCYDIESEYSMEPRHAKPLRKALNDFESALMAYEDGGVPPDDEVHEPKNEIDEFLDVVSEPLVWSGNDRRLE